MGKINKPILYSPSGNINKGMFAIYFGADGVYLGLDKYGLRKTENIDFSELSMFINFCHEKNKKIDITLNAYLRDFEINEFKNYLKEIINLKVDSIIISDPAVIILYNEMINNSNNKDKINKIDRIPNLTLSTQANSTNFYSMKFWANQGIKRIVAARELSLKELYFICKQKQEQKLNFELETFIHGAMCVSISGRCLLSLYMTNKKFSKKGSDVVRDANRGQCVHPCRFAYLVEQSRENEFFPIEEDERYSYVLSSKDLALLYYIPLLMYANIDAFKIEGRMKSSFYVSTVTFAYKKAIDKTIEIFKDIEIEENKLLYYFDNPKNFLTDYPDWYDYVKSLEIFIELASHRPYTTGFYFDSEYPDYMMPLYDSKLVQKYKIFGESILNADDYIKNNNLKINDNQFLFFSKNSFQNLPSTIFVFNKNGINRIENYKVLSIEKEIVKSIQHSNNYIIEINVEIIKKLTLNPNDIFFIFVENI